MHRLYFHLVLISILLSLSACGGGGDSSSNTISEEGDTQVALGTLGAIVFREGSFAAGTVVNISETDLPVLSALVTPVGKAYRVDLAEQIAFPASVTLPIPDGESGENLVLVRVQREGRVTLLDTRVIEGMLVAETPGFSTILAARFEQLNMLRPLIQGADRIAVRTTARYSEAKFLDAIPGLKPRWKLYELEKNMDARMTSDPSSILNQNMVFISTGNPGKLKLEVQFYEPTTEFNAVSYKEITVRPFLDAVDQLNLDIFGPNLLLKGNMLELNARVLNTDVREINSWQWSLDGDTEFCTTRDCRKASLSINSNNLVFGNYKFTVNAVSDEGLLGSKSIDVRLIGDKVEIIDLTQTPEESNLVWNEQYNLIPEITLGVQVYGGVPPYTYKWLIHPLSSLVEHVSTLDVDSHSFQLDQPGGYKYGLLVTDSQNVTTVSRRLDLTVGGALPFTYAIKNIPASVEIGIVFNADLEISGGLMIQYGSFDPVREYWVDWGDSTTADFGEISGQTPQDLLTRNLSHQYLTPGDYTIKYTVIEGDYTTGIENLVIESANFLAFQQKQITVLPATLADCAQYEVRIGTDCVDYSPPSDLLNAAQISAITSTIGICPPTRQQEFSVYIPADSYSSGSYTRCDYASSQPGADLISEGSYVEHILEGIRINYVNGEVYSFQQQHLATDINNSIILDSTGFVGHISQTWNNPSRYLQSNYAQTGEWQYRYREGTYPNTTEREVFFDSMDRIYRIFLYVDSLMERDMQFDSSGVMTQCSLKDGNTVLGSCL